VTLRRGDVLALTVLLGALAVLAATAPQWARLLPQADPRDDAAPPIVRGPVPPSPSADAGRKISVRLYFEQQEQGSLLPEDREILYSTDLSQQIRTVVEELVRGSLAGHLPPLPPDTKVLGVFVSARGTAFVDLSKEATGGAAGSLGERLSVYALVNSVAANFPAIRRVQILIDDRPADTFAGHVDLSRPLAPDMTLVAVKAPPLEPMPGEPKPALAPSTPSPPSA
jgi:hypothetical protein